MNGNSTLVSGMGGVNPFESPKSQGSFNQSGNNTYANGSTPTSSIPTASEGGNGPKVGPSPVVGFLYSISNHGIREYWPVHLGANTIGRDSSVDIQMNEATVSGLHAQINTKFRKGELIASLQDKGSKHGLSLNGEELDYEQTPCKNGDVITIGCAYKLVLILIDPAAYGLEENPQFIATEVASKEDVPPIFGRSGHMSPGAFSDGGGTIGVDGVNDFNETSGTMIMG